MTSSLGWMLASPNAMLVHLRREGNKLFDKPLPQLESDLAKLFEDLKQYGHVWPPISTWDVRKQTDKMRLSSLIQHGSYEVASAGDVAG
nr:hypothetical protein [Corynebacterium ulcerans]